MLALAPGDHLCLVYDDDPAEQLPVLLPYVQQGLEAGERCVYVADDQTVDELRAALRGYGIEVDAHVASGALLLWTRAEWRQPGPLHSDKKAAQVRAAIADALDAGFAGVRFAVEMTWTLGPDIDAGRLRHWEATINTIFTSDVPARIICQYSRRRLASEVVEAGLFTHPVAVLGEEVCPNPYYEAPRILEAGRPPRRVSKNGASTNGTHTNGTRGAPARGTDGARVDWMIAQLRRARAFEREREQRVRAEAALVEAERGRKRIEELYEATQIATAELRKALAAKDEFLGLLSHELKTPITTIAGNAEIVRRANGRLTPEDRDGALLDIEQSAERLHRMVDNLLAFARVGADQLIEREPHLARRIVDALVAEHRRDYPHRRIEVTVTAPITPVLLHRDYFEQVMRNLLGNAEKYSPPPEPIEVRIEREGAELVVSVLDRGPGIAEGEEEQIFEPFFRSKTTARRAKGVGIGLAVCRRLIEAQGGTITVSRRGDGERGARFTLRLPAEDPDAE